MKKFPKWFEKTYGTPAPADLLEYFTEHPDGLTVEQGSLYTAEDMVAYTEERELGENGVLYLGTGASLTVLLLRAKDGKVFLVDKTDFQSVDATFRDLGTCQSVMGFF